MKKLLLLGVVPGIPENYFNVQAILSSLNIEAIEFTAAADIKMCKFKIMNSYQFIIFILWIASDDLGGKIIWQAQVWLSLLLSQHTISGGGGALLFGWLVEIEQGKSVISFVLIKNIYILV